jgi:hypothetical protein
MLVKVLGASVDGGGEWRGRLCCGGAHGARRRLGKAAEHVCVRGGLIAPFICGARFNSQGRRAAWGTRPRADVRSGGRRKTRVGSGGECVNARHRGVRRLQGKLGVRAPSGCCLGSCGPAGGPDAESGGAPRGTAHVRGRGRARRILAGAVSPMLTHLPLFD